MKHRWPLIVSVFFLLAVIHLTANPSSILVIGGGPTGLGAAIEARKSGADVILVEKRDTYTRQTTLFLYTVTLELFEKWNVPIPLMEELEFKGERRGFVFTKDLETSLAHRADTLGVQRIQGEFIDFIKGSHTAIVQTADGNKYFPYDILVGADGTHSRVREKLGIACHSLGKSIGGISIVPAINSEKKIAVEIQPHTEVFAKKVSVPSATILFIQNKPDTPFKSLNSNEMIRFASEVGWQEEAMKMEMGNLFTIENIPIYLQRAATFSDSIQGVILLGDAASSASFYQGTGANFSFKTIQLARELFRNWQKEDTYAQFNHDMEIEATKLINISLPLFEPVF